MRSVGGTDHNAKNLRQFLPLFHGLLQAMECEHAVQLLRTWGDDGIAATMYWPKAGDLMYSLMVATYSWPVLYQVVLWLRRQGVEPSEESSGAYLLWMQLHGFVHAHDATQDMRDLTAKLTSRLKLFNVPC